MGPLTVAVINKDAGPDAAALTNDAAVAAYGDLLQAAIDRAVASRDPHT